MREEEGDDGQFWERERGGAAVQYFVSFSSSVRLVLFMGWLLRCKGE